MDSATVTFQVEAIPPATLDEIRHAGRDAAGNRLCPLAAEGGEPLRCCLRMPQPGEQIALIAYQPPGGSGPYREIGPVFVHAAPCDGYARDGGWPPEFRSRQQVLRGYGHDGRIADAMLVNGSEAERGIASLLNDPRIVMVQSRNVMYGCYMFAVRRDNDAG